MPFMLALLVLTSCEFLNKKTTEKAVSSKRKIASVNPYQNPSRNQISVSNKAVSAVVLVKDQKPICTLSVAKAPHLVPESLKVDPRQNTLDLKLPQCSQEKASMIKRTIGEAIVLDKHGGYRTAGPPIALGVTAWCLLGTSFSLMWNDPQRLRSKHKNSDSFRRRGAFYTTATALGVFIGNLELEKAFRPLQYAIGSSAGMLGVAGICNTGTTVAIYLFAE